MRTLIYRGKELGAIKFFKDGKVFVTLRSGWIEDLNSKRDVSGITFLGGDIKKKNKLDLTYLFPFVFKERRTYPYFGETIYVLYIPAEFVQMVDLGEVITYEGLCDTNYAQEYELTLLSTLTSYFKETLGTFDIMTPRTIRIHENFRQKETLFGKQVQDVQRELEKDKIHIPHHDLTELMIRYDLVKKG